MDIQIKIEQFAKALRWVRRQDGDPSYRDLHRRMQYSIATISRALGGESFPRWDVTEQLLRACHVPDEQIHGVWHTRWLEIAELRSPIGDFPYQAEPGTIPEPAPATPAGTECAECGALITNPLRHQAWHTLYVRRPAATRGRRPLTAVVPETSGTLHRLSS